MDPLTPLPHYPPHIYNPILCHAMHSSVDKFLGFVALGLFLFNAIILYDLHMREIVLYLYFLADSNQYVTFHFYPSIHVAVYCTISSFLRSKAYPIVYMYHSFSIPVIFSWLFWIVSWFGILSQWRKGHKCLFWLEFLNPWADCSEMELLSHMKTQF